MVRTPSADQRIWDCCERPPTTPPQFISIASDTETLSLAVGVAQEAGVIFDIVGAVALCLAVPALVEQSIEIALVEIVAAD